MSVIRTAGFVLVLSLLCALPGVGADRRQKPTVWRLKETVVHGSGQPESAESLLEQLPHVRVTTPGDVVEGLVWGKGSGYVAILSVDGSITLLKESDVLETSALHEPFRPLTPQELVRKLAAELPWKFRWYRVGPYVVGSTADSETTGLVSETLRRHYAAYRRYMERRRLPFQEPVFPLPVLVFGRRNDFVVYAERELRKGVDEHFAGYYSLTTNRAAFTLEGRDDWRGLGSLTHEVTHQLTYNTGFLKRFAHYPRWFLEGFATYFEAVETDGTGQLRWGGSGKVNIDRLEAYQSGRVERMPDTLRDLVLFDRHFAKGRKAVHAYAEAWALTYFLAERRPQQFRAYLELLATRPVLREYDGRQRLQDFTQTFGTDFKVLDRMIRTEMDRIARR